MGGVPGISVETTVVIAEPYALGLAVAHLNSGDQAQFLCGLANGFEVFDGGTVARHGQMESAATSVRMRPHDERCSVAPFLADLLVFVEAAQAAADAFAATEAVTS